MKNFLALVGGYTILKAIYETGKVVGEVKGSIKQIRNIRKELKEELKELNAKDERIARA